MTDIVVIGAGQAGASLVAKLRTEGFDGNITLIGAEDVPPYQRPPLSKAYLLGEMEESRLYLRPHSFYNDKRITLKLGASVEAIDTDARTVALETGETVPYDQLALTTGSTPRRLPDEIGGGLKGVYEMRTLRDADGMAPDFAEGKRALIVGGGYIGLEAAAVAAKRGVQVTLVETADRILQRVACPETSDFFRKLHHGHGVEIREGTGLARLTGTDGVLTGAVLSDGQELELDFAIVGIGIAPATTLAEASGLEVDNGIRVDAHGRTSAPGVWAAGDCASFHRQGQWIRLESVQNAIDQAEAVAANMLGAGTDYDPKPWFWSDQYDVKLQIAGLNVGYDRVVVRPGEGGSVSHWYYAGDTLLAVDAMNAARDYMVGKRLIDGGRTADPALVADPEADLKQLLKG